METIAELRELLGMMAAEIEAGLNAEDYDAVFAELIDLELILRDIRIEAQEAESARQTLLRETSLTLEYAEKGNARAIRSARQNVSELAQFLVLLERLPGDSTINLDHPS